MTFAQLKVFNYFCIENYDNNMKQTIYTIIALITISFAVPAWGVTDKEMEQARVIATQTYLRYVNNGSGYLDDLKPKTMSELEAGLKAKEKENIKVFKAIKIPGDYKGWDKDKLVDFWTTTAFHSPGLDKKGLEGLKAARKKISALKISAPSDNSKDAPMETPKEADIPVVDETIPATEKSATPDSQAAAPNDSIALQQSAADAGLTDELDEETVNKVDNHTWIYIVILCLLVGVVVALVVFASNVMKRGKADETASNGTGGFKPVESGEEQNSLREKYAAMLVAKNTEIGNLTKRVDELTVQNSQLRRNLQSVTAELSSLKKETVKEKVPRAENIEKEEPTMTKPSAVRSSVSVPNDVSAPVSEKSKTRTIYLGRVNNQGRFVRADRALNVKESVYRLDTTDGFSGTFRVVNNPAVWESTLKNPQMAFSVGCVVANLEEADGMEHVVTDSAGTAIFESGSWKVIRKAKIHFE